MLTMELYGSSIPAPRPQAVPCPDRPMTDGSALLIGESLQGHHSLTLTPMTPGKSRSHRGQAAQTAFPVSSYFPFLSIISFLAPVLIFLVHFSVFLIISLVFHYFSYLLRGVDGSGY